MSPAVADRDLTDATRGPELATGPLSGPDRSRVRADPRLGGYLVAGFGALVAAVLAGVPALAALGAPFVALAARGLLPQAPAAPRGRLTLDAPRVIEGETLEAELTVEWEGEADVDIVVTDLRGVAPGEGDRLHWAVRGTGPVIRTFRLRAEAWGTHRPARLWVRLQRPGSLRVHEHRLAVAPPLRVLPDPLRLDRLLRPPEPRAVAGAHLSRLRGSGTDFAELRPYQPGDRLRNVAWATSARLGTPWVTVHHPERTGTILLLLDTFFTDREGGQEARARIARTAWAVASLHLRVQDRVGILAAGRAVAWVPPQGGRRARALLIDELLDVGAAAEDFHGRRRRAGRVLVPSDALVVGITPLRSTAFTRELVHYRRTGRRVVVLGIDTGDLGASEGDPVREAARRVWLVEREIERRALEDAGIPTVLVTDAGGVGPAVTALGRRLARSRAGGVAGG
ncbi:MAG TPA: DUF58 domain-containing protein [Longimicrobiales bacterium]|nr:DUF58 domain-containing protein [Longimicrobiales bacterium]